MIISGDFIAINSKEDFVPFEDDKGTSPDGIWFNIRNIVSLSCYKDYYRLIIDDEHMVELRQPAANELIALMRKERDDKAHEEWNKIKALRNELRGYGYDLKFKHDDNGKTIKASIEEIKEDK